ncbi:hypothetical protein [Burkholderia pseudomultivorans]|uniref:hypothetical protein n=1 Tax=Burkholderia pseudomultivorans TaxID=1207504 RepID=UPI0001FDB43A|nr:hypothetical protein [Burkholderia pseudomultivorans]AOI93469.1 hypothetical protein WS57_33265 [Burkholderia pseudomultivorans]EGD06520.1 hypothetical protein B1M_01002 [Burkholderia sp. TJI49]
MRRQGVAIIFAILGLVSWWGWAGVDIEICQRFPQRCVTNGCKEIGACPVDFVEGLGFLSAIFGPSILFYVAAVLFGSRRRNAIQWVVLLSMLVAAHWLTMLSIRLI